MLPVEQPFKTYTGIDGKPLNNGYVYFGQPGQDPITHPVTVYWDAAGTLPAAQPLRTVNGYVVNGAGFNANPFFSGSYSTLVLDSKSRQVLYAPLSDEYSTAPLVTKLQAKASQRISAKADFSAAVNGSTDDTTAINNARAAVATTGGEVFYGGKTFASGFWENLAPLTVEWIKGLPTAHATDVTVSKPVVGGKLFNGTPTAGAGYAGYLMRMDGYTKAGVDVASTVVGLFSMQSYSTNSAGANFNNTNQVALVANSSAMDAAASASVEAFNAIAYSAYTGALPQMVIGVESDVGAERAPGWFGDASKAFGVAFSAVLASGTKDFTAAFACDTASASMAFLHGYVASGVRTSGVTVARNGAIVPDTGVSVVAASTYGVYIGAKNRFALNPGSAANFTYKPAIGLALGQEGATSANSHKLRLVATNGSGAELNWDIYADSVGEILFDYNGSNKVSIGASGAYLVQGQQIIGARQTGFTAMTGTADKSTAFDTSTITLPQLAQRVKALQDSDSTHGLIGS